MAHSTTFTRTVLISSSATALGLLGLAAWTKNAAIEDLPSWLAVAGNLHPVFLHLPIGAFIYLAVAETWNLVDRAFLQRGQIRGSFPILSFGTVTAVIAAVVGLLLYLQGDYSGDLVEQHLNWGVGFAISALFLLCCFLIFEEHSQIYRALLLVTTVLVSVAGHWGGLITHGDPLEPLLKRSESTQIDQVISSYAVVDAIFADKCHSCHAVDTKQKGRLLMDSYDALLAGGKTGPALVPGDLEKSLLSSYVHLPLEHEHHMPPEGKPQLTPDEIRFIDAWILSAAPSDKALDSSDLSDDLVTWARNYMAATTIVAESAQVTDAPVDSTAPTVDLDWLIQHVEEHAENSITRIDTSGEQLAFSAVNARSHFDDHGLEALSELAPYLIDVNLSGTSIDESSLSRFLERTSQLERINLSHMKLGVGWIEAASKLKHLQSIILYGTLLTSEALDALGQLEQVQTLYLAETGLSQAQVDSLQAALPDCEIVSDAYLQTHQPKASEPQGPKGVLDQAGTPAGLPLAHSSLATLTTAANLAAGKSVQADSYYNVGAEVFPATNVTDSRPADSGSKGDWSFWIAEDGIAGTVTVDLGVATEINRIDLQNTRNRWYGDRGLDSFSLQSSTDGARYRTLLHGRLAAVAEHKAEAYSFHSYSLAAHTARYIRIIGHSYHGKSGGLNEVRIYNDQPGAKTHSHGADGHTHEHAQPASEESHFTGSGEYRYQSNPQWAQFNDGKPVGPTHGGVAVSKTGEVYVSTDGPRAISVFNSQGTYLRSLKNNMTGVHSLMIREEDGVEYIYGAHYWGQAIIKLDLEGNVVQQIKHSDEHAIPGTLKGLTGVTVGPDGRIYAVVGYGSNHMHIFSPEGELLKTVGSKGKAEDQTQTNHGISLDTRYSPARLLVADRENWRLKHYDLEGNFIGIYASGLRRPCSFSFYGDLCAVAELAGRVTLLDKDGKVLVHLGDNPKQEQRAKFKVPLDQIPANIFSAPHGLSFDLDGNLIVQDWNETGRLTMLTRVEENAE
ncbi:c-type cytochrome domain-containing protein [Coraliomargarita akajimensis]|uniref:Coagulation factor 5/8 type domain protein n=1 Tax=Coraliomargarita akajimensis (strain DSM 45221 / IAM 15411 / JCM 23193 / KCTC 12865 / 04OKA010-24) TaxID=583355 RepID=D5ENX9_CORAD|nr:c-type cytochrome domain-containing protein [Coraliomargarita akajimensis]ADE53638.1 coagulation factor 5/8 type domain protein [Coraliomargarita akajimensis DSM 45221]